MRERLGDGHKVFAKTRRDELYREILARGRKGSRVIALVDLARRNLDVNLDGWLVVHTLSRHPDLQTHVLPVVLSAKTSAELERDACEWGAVGYVSRRWLSNADQAELQSLIDALGDTSPARAATSGALVGRGMDFVTRFRNVPTSVSDHARIAELFEQRFPDLKFEHYHLELLWQLAHGVPGDQLSLPGGMSAKKPVQVLRDAATRGGAISGTLQVYYLQFLDASCLTPTPRLGLHDLSKPWVMRSRFFTPGDFYATELSKSSTRAMLTDTERLALKAFLSALPNEPDTKDVGARIKMGRTAMQKAARQIPVETGVAGDLARFEDEAIRAALKLQAVIEDERTPVDLG